LFLLLLLCSNKHLSLRYHEYARSMTNLQPGGERGWHNVRACKRAMFANGTSLL
jgi:hypothetical protein